MQVNPEELIVPASRWIESFLRLKAGSVAAETTINHELGVAGDDGIELVEAIANHFGLSGYGFPVEHYFGPEQAVGVSAIVLGLFRKTRGRPIASVEPLSVRQLVTLLHTAEAKTP